MAVIDAFCFSGSRVVIGRNPSLSQDALTVCAQLVAVWLREWTRQKPPSHAQGPKRGEHIEQAFGNHQRRAPTLRQPTAIPNLANSPGEKCRKHHGETGGCRN